MEEKIKTLIENNSNEIEKIEAKTGKYSSWTDEERENAKVNVQNEITKLKEMQVKYNEKGNEISSLEAKLKGQKDPSDREATRKSIKEKKQELNRMAREDSQKLSKPMQGKITEIISSYTGEIDKKIHNWLYVNHKKRWDRHVKNVDDRYKNGGIKRYLPKRLIAAAAIAGLALIGPAGSVPLLVSTFGPIVQGIILAADGIFAANAIIKSAHTIYNKNKFGGHSIDKNNPKKEVHGKWYDFSNNLANGKKAVNNFKKAKNSINKFGTVYSKASVMSPIYPSSAEKTVIDPSLGDTKTIVNNLANNILHAHEKFNNISEENILYLNHLLVDMGYYKEELLKLSNYEKIEEQATKIRMFLKLFCLNDEKIKDMPLENIEEIINAIVDKKEIFPSELKEKYEKLLLRKKELEKKEPEEKKEDNGIKDGEETSAKKKEDSVNDGKGLVSKPVIGTSKEDDIISLNDKIYQAKREYNRAGMEYWRSIGENNESTAKENMKQKKERYIELNNYKSYIQIKAMSKSEMAKYIMNFKNNDAIDRGRIVSMLIDSVDFNNVDMPNNADFDTISKIFMILDKDNEALNSLSIDELSKINSVASNISHRIVINKKSASHVNIKEILPIEKYKSKYVKFNNVLKDNGKALQIRYVGICEFSDENGKTFEKQILLENKGETYIAKRIHEVLPEFSGTISFPPKNIDEAIHRKK